jgi:endonuclease YncB( thermonuclease family)
MYEYAAELIELHDGDTLHAKVQLGLDISVNATIRFYGINAPELATQAGKDALVYGKQWFAIHCPAGVFTLRTIKDHREKYGRYLGIIVAPDLANMNDDMVSSGHAVVYML